MLSTVIDRPARVTQTLPGKLGAEPLKIGKPPSHKPSAETEQLHRDVARKLGEKATEELERFNARTALTGETHDAKAANLIPNIRAEHEAVHGCMQEMVPHAIAAGKMLRTAKDLIGHGGWKKWCERKLKISVRTCQTYMYLAGPEGQQAVKKLEREQQHGPTSKAQRAAHLSIRAVLSSTKPARTPTSKATLPQQAFSAITDAEDSLRTVAQHLPELDADTRARIDERIAGIADLLEVIHPGLFKRPARATARGAAA